VNLLEPARPRWTEIALSVLRIVAALVFMQHGSQKLFGFPPSAAAGPVPPLVLVSQTGLAGVLEFFGGLLFLLGAFTRLVQGQGTFNTTQIWLSINVLNLLRALHLIQNSNAERALIQLL